MEREGRRDLSPQFPPLKNLGDRGVCVRQWRGNPPSPPPPPLSVQSGCQERGGGRGLNTNTAHTYTKRRGRERGNRRGFSTLSSLWTIDSNQPPPPPLLLQSVRFVIHRHPSPFQETGRKGKGKRHRRRHFQQLAFSFLFELPSHIPIKKFPSKDQPQLVAARRNTAPFGIFSSSFAATVCLCVSNGIRGVGRPSEDWRSERDVGFAKGAKGTFLIFPFYVLLKKYNKQTACNVEKESKSRTGMIVYHHCGLREKKKGGGWGKRWLWRIPQRRGRTRRGMRTDLLPPIPPLPHIRTECAMLKSQK